MLHSSMLRLRPRRHHHDQTYTCQAQNTADRAYRSATVKLKVSPKPLLLVLNTANFKAPQIVNLKKKTNKNNCIKVLKIYVKLNYYLCTFAPYRHPLKCLHVFNQFNQ